MSFYTDPKPNDAEIDVVFSIDGYIDARHHSPSDMADFILQRVELVGE